MTYHHDTAPDIDLHCPLSAPTSPRADHRMMSANEYRDAIEQLGLGLNEAKRFLGVSDKTSRKYAEEGPSRPVEMLLKFMLAKDFMPEDVNSAIRRWERDVS